MENQQQKQKLLFNGGINNYIDYINSIIIINASYKNQQLYNIKLINNKNNFKMKTTTKLFAMVAIFATVLFASCKKETTAPVADFSYSFGFSTKVDTFGYRDTVSFANLSTDADTYLWSFGDGTTSSEESPRKSYQGVAVTEDYTTFSVTLTASKNGKSSTKTKNIVEYNPK